MDRSAMTALELGACIKERTLGCREVTRHFLARISEREPALNAFITVLEEDALRQADLVQARLDAGESLSPLAGVPVALKDNICTENVPTTCASKMLEHFRPPYSATAARRLERAGMVLVGKTNLDEFAMGGSTETSYFGPAKKPWNLKRVPGGSSGGSAAAVAAGEVPCALGSDTGGSIRQPCAFCGVSGLKPTYGAVSRYGLVAYASSLDQIGPIARDIRDCAALLSAMEGSDPHDATSLSLPPRDLLAACEEDITGLRIGIPEGHADGLEEDVAASVLAAARELERQGAALVPVRLPLADRAVAAYHIIACAEASANLARYDGVRYGFQAEADSFADLCTASRSAGFGIEVKQRVLLGTLVLSAAHRDTYYQKAQQIRAQIRRDFAHVFESCDLILSPSAPTTAYRLGQHIAAPRKMYLDGVYTVSANLAGLPAASIPCGFDRNGLPIGLQLIAPHLGEPLLLRAAAAYQRVSDHHTRRPKGGVAP